MLHPIESATTLSDYDEEYAIIDFLTNQLVFPNMVTSVLLYSLIQVIYTIYFLYY